MGCVTLRSLSRDACQFSQKNKWGARIRQPGTLDARAKFIAPAVFLWLATLAFTDGDKILLIIQKIAIIYTVTNRKNDIYRG